MFERILVTGASGRLGSNLAKQLLDRGEKVRALVVPNDPAEKSLAGLDVETVYGDLRDEKLVDQAVDGCDAVAHCAAVMGVPEGMSPHTFYDINCRGSFNVFQAVCDRADRVKRLVYISSTSAYSVEVQGPVITEETPLTPLSLYGSTKAANETMLRTMVFQYGIKTVVLRPNFIMACDEIINGFRRGWVTGVLQHGDARYSSYNPDAVEPWKIVEAAAPDPNQHVIPYGPGHESWVWHVTDVRDCAQAVQLALENDRAIGETFCIASPQPARWSEVVPYLCDKLGDEYVEVELPNLWHFEFDLSKARNVLGYDPQYGPKRMIDDGLRFRNGEDIGVIPPAIAHG